jgi:hypothetical protein
MYVGQWVVPSVPPTVTGVETAHRCDLVVDNAELLVVGEVVNQLA